MHLPGTLGAIGSPDVRPAAPHPGRYLEFCGKPVSFADLVDTPAN
jgi:hypothetical protein